MKVCEFLANSARFNNECKALTFCKHHGYGENKAGESYHECNREGYEYAPEVEFNFGVGYYC